MTTPQRRRTLLSGTKVTKRLGGLTAFSEVDFEARRGQIMGGLGNTRSSQEIILRRSLPWNN